MIVFAHIAQATCWWWLPWTSLAWSFSISFCSVLSLDFFHQIDGFWFSWMISSSLAVAFDAAEKTIASKSELIFSSINRSKNGPLLKPKTNLFLRQIFHSVPNLHPTYLPHEHELPWFTVSYGFFIAV